MDLIPGAIFAFIGMFRALRAKMIGFFILAFTMKWYSPGDGIGSFAITIAMMTVAYIAIWLANYLSYRSQLNQINKELDELKALELSGVSKV